MAVPINPATDKPFKTVNPNQRIMRLRREIMKRLSMNYDAAQTTSQNEKHWAASDELSPNAANSLAVRKKLRSRSRYETANSGYLQGIQLSICNDFVGTGPTLQVSDTLFTEAEQGAIEKAWMKRSKKIRLRKKLWQLRKARIQDGEGFAFAFVDRKMKGAKRNYKVVECDQVSSFDSSIFSPGQRKYEIDGIRFDKVSGEPTFYHLLNQHPGETQIFNLEPLEGQWVREKEVLHWFRQDRPWLRGIPETTSTLPLWALLRRYTLAVVQNAEIAADFTVLLKSLGPPATNQFALDGDGEPTETNEEDWFDSFPIDRGLMTVLPDMYDLQQLDPAQPVGIYDSFVKALVNEASRPLLTPSNYAQLNSGDYNMASGNLDRQIYLQMIEFDRQDANDEILSEDFEEWWFEAIRTPGYFREQDATIRQKLAKNGILREEAPEHSFRWDQVPEHVDPLRVAQAVDLLHRGGHISDIDIQEKRFNRRVEEHWANLEKQNAWRKDNDLVHEPNQTTHTISEQSEIGRPNENGKGKEENDSKPKQNGHGRFQLPPAPPKPPKK